MLRLAKTRFRQSERLATPLRKGVRLVGKKRLFAVLRFLVLFTMMAWLLTIKAC